MDKKETDVEFLERVANKIEAIFTVNPQLDLSWADLDRLRLFTLKLKDSKRNHTT